MDDFKQLELKIKDYKIKELKSLNKILLYFLNNLSIGNERQKDISSSYQLKEIKANVNHFYKELDKRIYTDILDLLNKENIYYKNQKGIQGLTTIQEDKIHIIMNLNNSLEDHFLLAHELMHGLVLKNSFPFLKMDERLFEIESHFIEFLLSDFLLKNKYEENSILNYNLKRSKMVFRHAHRSFWELNLINVYNQFGSLEKDLVYNYFKTSYLVHDQEKIKLIIQGLTKEKFNLNYALRYFWGELISHQLYTNYKKEPAYNLNLFKNYIYNNSSLTFEKGLEKLNISFNPQIINNYAKYVKNNQLKLKTLEKKYK